MFGKAAVCAIFAVILAALPFTVFAAASASQDKALVAARDAFLAG
ncbi:MAG: hypothetical protein ACD_75C01703G0003, partial [uncultured bacterium]